LVKPPVMPRSFAASGDSSGIDCRSFMTAFTAQ
jgi:hypothetical protein